MKESRLDTKKGLESELNSLSKRAKSLITPPQLDISTILSQMDSNNISKISFAQITTRLVTSLFSRPALSFAIIILSVLSIFYFSDSQQNIIQNSLITDPLSTQAILTEIDEDLKFAETMNNLEDYALSGFITSSDDQNYNLDEFIEFVTPTSNGTI